MPHPSTLLLLIGLAWLNAARAEECARIDPARVATFFDEWNLALASLKPEHVAARYWPDAVLLPTASNTPRTTPTMMREYFTHFLAQRPRGRVEQRQVQIGCNLAIDTGAYTFSLMNEHGNTSELAARYTYVYAYRKGAWKILHHHSSAMPEPLRTDAAEKLRPSTRAGGGERTALATPFVGGTRPFLNIDASPPLASFYPKTAIERREHGAVAMEVCAGPTGELQGDPEVLQSSGFEQLDAAAQAWAQAARWIPATRNNKPVDGCTKINVVFDKNEAVRG